MITLDYKIEVFKWFYKHCNDKNKVKSIDFNSNTILNNSNIEIHLNQMKININNDKSINILNNDFYIYNYCGENIPYKINKVKGDMTFINSKIDNCNNFPETVKSLSFIKKSHVLSFEGVSKNIKGYLYAPIKLDNIDFLESIKCNEFVVVTNPDQSDETITLTRTLYNQVKNRLSNDSDDDIVLNYESQLELIKEGIIGMSNASLDNYLINIFDEDLNMELK